MGSGVSVHRHPDSAMKFRFSTGSSKAKKILNNQDPVTNFGFKSTQPSLTPPLTSFRHTGSKEEDFFDSQAWLESDCEDDFLSVNGDYTPSRGSTSSNQNISVGNSQLDRSQLTDGALSFSSEPSPTDKKKKLSELLQENLGGDEVYYNQNTSDGELKSIQNNVVHHSKSTNGISHMFSYLSKSNSVRSSDRTPSRSLKSEKEKEKSPKSAQCCLPSLVTSLSFRERKKRLSNELSGEG